MGLFSDKYTEFFEDRGYGYIMAVRMGNTAQYYNMPLEAFNDYSADASGIGNWVSDWGGKDNAFSNYTAYKGDLDFYQENTQQQQNLREDTSRVEGRGNRETRETRPTKSNIQSQWGEDHWIPNFLRNVPDAYEWIQDVDGERKMPDWMIRELGEKFPEELKEDTPEARALVQDFVDAVNSRQQRDGGTINDAFEDTIRDVRTQEDVKDAIVENRKLGQSRVTQEAKTDKDLIKSREDLSDKIKDVQDIAEETAETQTDRSEEDFERAEEERARARQLQDQTLADFNEQRDRLREERYQSIINYNQSRQNYQDDRVAQKGLISELRNAPSTYEEAQRQGHEQSLKNMSALASVLPTRAGGSTTRDLLNQQQQLDLNIAQSSSVGRLEEITQRRNTIANILASQQGAAQNQQQLDLSQADASRLGLGTEIGVAGVPLGIADTSRQDSYADRGLSDTNLQQALANQSASLGFGIDNLKLQQAIDAYEESGDQQEFANRMQQLGLGINAVTSIINTLVSAGAGLAGGGAKVSQAKDPNEQKKSGPALQTPSPSYIVGKGLGAAIK